jgi:hypothetical protein
LRSAGIEPALADWKSDILPLNYKRDGSGCTRNF